MDYPIHVAIVVPLLANPCNLNHKLRSLHVPIATKTPAPPHTPNTNLPKQSIETHAPVNNQTSMSYPLLLKPVWKKRVTLVQFAPKAIFVALTITHAKEIKKALQKTITELNAICSLIV